MDVVINGYGWTPLHVAYYKNNIKLGEYLIKKNANREIKNNSGYTPYELGLYNLKNNCL